MSEFGKLLKEWREKRKLSQHALSNLSGVSQRHVSYLETGKSNPSRQMIMTLCDTLDIPSNVRNHMMLSCRYATKHASRNYSLPVDERHLRSWVNLQAKTPSVLVDELWNIEAYSEGLTNLLNLFGGAEELLEKTTFDTRPNLLSSFYMPTNLCSCIQNGDLIGRIVLARLFQKTQLHPNEPGLTRLLEHLDKGQFGERGWWNLVEHESFVPSELIMQHKNSRLSFSLVHSIVSPNNDELSVWHVLTFIPSDDITKAVISLSSETYPPAEPYRTG